MSLYYKQSDDIERIRTRIRKFELIRKVSMIAFIILSVLCCIDFILIHLDVIEVSFYTIFLVLFWMLSLLMTFSGKFNETKNIIKDLKRREQELIQQEKLGKAIAENDLPQFNSGIVSFFGSWPAVLKIIVSLVLIFVEGYVILFTIQTDQLYFIKNGRISVFCAVSFLVLLPVGFMWFPNNYKTISPKKRTVYGVLLWIFIVVAVLFAFLVVALLCKNITT